MLLVFVLAGCRSFLDWCLVFLLSYFFRDSVRFLDGVRVLVSLCFVGAGLLLCIGGGLVLTVFSTESLILAQDERWRRA